LGDDGGIQLAGIERRLEWMRPAEILAEMGRCPLVYVPVGLLEWHGPHLPVGTDALDAETVALRCAERSGGVVLPTCYCGTERECTPQQLRDLGFVGDEWIVGMDFPKNALRSLYFREEFFALVLREWLTLLALQGYRLIVIINGHGADNHIAVIERLSREFSAAGGVRVVPFLAWAAPDGALDVGHADAIETARMVALDAERVDLATLPAADKPLYNTEWGIVDARTFRGEPTPDRTTRNDPRVGTSPEYGEETFAVSVAYIVDEVERLLREMR